MKIRNMLYLPILFMGLSIFFITSCIKEEDDDVTLTDSRDGNIYRTAKIGEQIWMTENLRYLPSVSKAATGSLTTPHYYVFNYDETDVSYAKFEDNYKIYGVLYNWPAAKSACPEGWHLPTDEEWIQLIDYLGGAEIAGLKLKESGTEHWFSSDPAVTNSTGFTALPGGLREYYGPHEWIGYFGYWWTSTIAGDTSAWYRYMFHAGNAVGKNNGIFQAGFSCRCVKD